MKRNKHNKGKALKCECGGHIKYRPVNKNRPQTIHLMCVKCNKIL